MKTLDHMLQKWRYHVVTPFIPHGCRLLDIGGYDGSFLYFVKDRLVQGYCLDPLCRTRSEGPFHLIQAHAGQELPLPTASVDVVTLLAVFEHIQEREALVREIFRVLQDEGLVILTVPQPLVDDILKVLIRLRIADGMAAEEHHHFDPAMVVPLFGRFGFSLITRARFQLGLNNIFVFRKTRRG
ncbi:MAG: class I SAM-dependent methyltransferase [Desulfosoma sp.]